MPEKKQPPYDVITVRYTRGHAEFTRWQKLCRLRDRDASDLVKQLIEKACDEAQIPTT